MQSGDRDSIIHGLANTLEKQQSSPSSLSPLTPRSKRLAKVMRKRRPIDDVEALLSGFGYNLTKQQLAQIEYILPEAKSNHIFSRQKSARGTSFWSLGKKRDKKAKKQQMASEQKVNLRQIEICQQIGFGASSAGVYMCIVDGWSCAMKQLKREHVGKLDIKCFEREMDILYQLPPHPNIVRYLFHTSIGPDLCLFMQLYGGTLRDYLDERRIGQQLLDVELIAEMALEIATGIQFLHKHGVIHRDIKAGNIFITKNEKGEITNLAVGDFDTSLRIQATASVADLKSMMMTSSTEMMVDPSTLLSNVKDKRKSPAARRNQFAKVRPVSTVGTAGFMAPEVLRARNSNPYGFKADVYSFGMVLYELCTLKLPFEKVDTCDIITAVLEGENVPSMEVDEKMREKYWKLLDLHTECTAFKESERPSLTQIISTLNSVRKGENYSRPPLISQKSRMSLKDQLSLYGDGSDNIIPNRDTIPDDPLSSLDSIEDVEKMAKERNKEIIFSGPQTQNLDDDTSESDSDSVDISFNKSEPIQRTRSVGEFTFIPQDRRHAPKRKVIVEIKDTEGNIVQEKILDENGNAIPDGQNSPLIRRPRERKKKRRRNTAVDTL